MTDSNFAGLAEFRCIGPFRGGRVLAVAGVDAALAEVGEEAFEVGREFDVCHAAD